MDSVIVTRDQAIETGKHQYFTSKPCKHGHVANRFVSTGGCCECHRLSCGRLRRSRGVPEMRRKEVARVEAEQNGWTRYESAIVCAKGHLGQRYTSNAYCVVCAGSTHVPRKTPQRIVPPQLYEPQAKPMTWEEILEYQRKNK